MSDFEEEMKRLQDKLRGMKAPPGHLNGYRFKGLSTKPAPKVEKEATDEAE